MASDTSLVFNILAKDKASKVFGRVQGGLDKMTKGIGIAAAGMAVGLAKIGGDFDKAFDTIAVGTGATGDKLEGLKSDFKDALADTPADMGVVAQAMTDLNTLTGATGDTLQDLTVGVADASRMLGEDGTANAKAFGKAMTQWQIPAEEGTGQLDTLFKATQDYGVGLGEITGHLNTYGSVLQNAGFSMEESAALFGQLESSGLSVSRVMPGLNKAFRDWAGEGKDLRTELDSTVGAIADAGSETEALSIATETFGAEGAQRMTTAIRSGALELDDLSEALSGADGLIGDTAEGTDSWKEKLQKLKDEGLVAVEPLASALFDKLGTGADIMKSVVQWGQKNTGTIKALGIALAAIAVTIVTVNVALKIFHAAMVVKAAVMGVVTAVTWLWNSALSANPIGIIIIAVAALVAALVVLYMKSETARKIMNAVFKGIVAVVKWWFNNIVKRYFAAVKKAFEFLVKAAKVWWEGVKLYFGFWKGLLESVIGWVVRVWKKVRETFNRVVGFVKKLPGRIKSAASGMWDGIKDAFRNALNWIIGKWNGLSFTLPSVNIFGATIGGGTISTPNIPKLAEGGIVTGPTLAILGEGGRDEAIIPLPKGPQANRGGTRIRAEDLRMPSGAGLETIFLTWLEGLLRRNNLQLVGGADG